MQIVKIKHDSNGEIIAYGLDNGEAVNKKQAVQMVESGKIVGAYVGYDGNGNKTITATSGANRIDNIKNLPELL